MFTGIIQTTGKVQKLINNQIVIDAPDEIIGELKKGSSIAVDGACLTVVEISDNSFTADFMPETAGKTIISTYEIDQLVNLELTMRANGRFEGHIVSGHVEGIGEITDIQSDSNAQVLTIKLADELMKYIVPKGSIAINGISLTVIDVPDNQFTVSIIPHTWEITNLHTLEVGGKVNVETDLLGKYVEKLIKGCRM